MGPFERGSELFDGRAHFPVAYPPCTKERPGLVQSDPGPNLPSIREIWRYSNLDLHGGLQMLLCESYEIRLSRSMESYAVPRRRPQKFPLGLHLERASELKWTI